MKTRLGGVGPRGIALLAVTGIACLAAGGARLGRP